jgi:hypothetical protein
MHLTMGTSAAPPVRPNVRRRWWQYSLRLLLVFVTLVACAAAWLGMHVRRCRREEVATRYLASLNAQVNVGYGSPFRDDNTWGGEAFFQGGPAWLTKLLGVDIYRTVTGLNCYAGGNRFSYGRGPDGQLRIDRKYVSGLADKDLEVVGKLAHLRYLQLEAHPVTDRGVRHLARLSELRVLNLGNTAISDDAVRVVAALPRLRELNVSRTDVTDACLDYLADSPSLRKLNVTITNVSEQAIVSFRRSLPGCEVEQ